MSQFLIFFKITADVAQSNFVLWLTYSCNGGSDDTKIEHGNGGGMRDLL